LAWAAGVQADISKQTKNTKSIDMGKYFIETVLFNLDYEIENSIYDSVGNKNQQNFQRLGLWRSLLFFFI
jgi:hypothetical protein